MSCRRCFPVQRNLPDSGPRRQRPGSVGQGIPAVFPQPAGAGTSERRHPAVGCRLPELLFTGRHTFPLWQIVGSLLILACPAGLMPATSLPAFVAAWHTARQQVLLRDGTVLGDFCRTTMFAFSETGTMTRDRVQLTDTFVFHQAPETGLLGLAAAMVQGADTPEAQAIREAAEGCRLPSLAEVNMPPSGGFEALCFHERVRLGTKEYVSRFLVLPSDGDAYADRLLREGKTVWYLTVGRRLYAVLGFPTRCGTKCLPPWTP